MNEITNTRVGDNIHYFVNGVEDSGMVVKMSNSYITIVKADGSFKDVRLNETFFVKDIILNKTWNDMNDGERLEALSKARVPSPRYVTKSWDQLPKELQTLLTKNNGIESSAKNGKDDDMNETKRIFDKSNELNSRNQKPLDSNSQDDRSFGEIRDQEGTPRPSGEPQPTDKATSGDINTLTESGGEDASSNSMVTDPKKRSGGFKLNTPIGTEGMAGEKGDKGFGQTIMTRQHGIQPRDPSTEEQKGVKRGGKHDSKENKEALGSSEVKLFSGYDDKGDSKGYNDKAWTDALNEVRTSIDVNKILPALGAVAGGIARGVGGAVADAGKEAVDSATEPDVEKSWIEKLNQVKSNVETSIHGNAGRNPDAGVSTSTNFDAPKDYEGASHSGIRLEQFKHENLKPKVKEHLDLGDSKPSDVQDGGNKYDTKTQPKTIKGRAADQEKDKKI
jgi:hypothetical protein